MEKRQSCGMTLIELLVVVSIIGILSTIGLVTYVNFNRTQILTQTTKHLVQDMRLTASLAANNQKPLLDANNQAPLLCANNSLKNYSFVVTGEHSYKITFKCGVDDKDDYDFKPEESVLPNITLSPVPWSARFLVMRQGVIFPEGEGKNQLFVSGLGKTKIIVISKAGDISIINE